MVPRTVALGMQLPDVRLHNHRAQAVRQTTLSLLAQASEHAHARASRVRGIARVMTSNAQAAEYRVGRLLVTEDGRFVLRKRKPQTWKRVPPIERVRSDEMTLELAYAIRRVAPEPAETLYGGPLQFERGSDDCANAGD